MQYRKYVALSGIFLFFVVAGGSWVGLSRLLPDGPGRAALVISLGILFVVVFFWLLVDRIRSLLATSERLWLQLGMVALQVVFLLLAFGVMYQHLGLRDASSGEQVGTFWEAAYLSIITFTTVGYGDYVPMGLSRILAALQGMTGYLVLGVLASTVFSLVSPHQKAGGTAAETELDGKD